MKLPELNPHATLDYAAYHKGGAHNLSLALNHPDSFLLFRSYHASAANPAAIDAKVKQLLVKDSKDDASAAANANPNPNPNAKTNTTANINADHRSTTTTTTASFVSASAAGQGNQDAPPRAGVAVVGANHATGSLSSSKEDDEIALWLSQRIKTVTKNHSLALNLYAFYKFFTSCILLPATLVWRTLDITSVPANALLGFSVATYAFTIFHMRNHRGRAFETKLIDNITRPWFEFIDNLFNVPPVLWRVNHNENHHVYPNAPTDYDLLTPYPYLRLSHELPHSPHHQFQWLYALPLLGFNGFIFPKHNMRLNTLQSWTYVAIYYSTLLVLPLLFGATVQQLLVAYVATIYIAGLITAVLFQVSHNHYDNHTAVHAPFTSFKQWLGLQFEESMSWGGLVACVLFGGINYQTEHHIVPAVEPILLHYLQKDIKELAGKLGVKYTYEPTFFDAVHQYLRCLYKFGKVDKRVD